MSYGWEAAHLFVEDFVWIFREYYFLIWSFVKFPVLQSFLCVFVNWLHCQSINIMLVMNLIGENSQISTSSRFRNFSGYVFF